MGAIAKPDIFDVGSLLSDKNLVIWEILKKGSFQRNENFLDMPGSTEILFFLFLDLKLRPIYGITCCVVTCVASVQLGSTKASKLCLGLGAQAEVKICGRDGELESAGPCSLQGYTPGLEFLSMLEDNSKVNGSVQLAWAIQMLCSDLNQRKGGGHNRLWKHVQVNSKSYLRWRIAANFLQWRTHDFCCVP